MITPRTVMHRLQRAAHYRTQWTIAALPRLRHTVAALVATALRVRHGTSSLSRQPLNDRDQMAVARLRTHGIALLPDLIPDSTIDALLAYFQPRDAMDKHGQLAPIAALPGGTAMASYPWPTILASTDVLRVINNHSVLKIAAAYLGCHPTLSSLAVRWSLPGTTESPEGTQRFHRDMEDFRFLRLFVYLTDVDGGAGPHLYVAKSHHSAGRLLNRYRDDTDRSDADNVQTIVGGRGTAFIADTYGIHAGMVPTKTPRLILQAQYSLLPNHTVAYAPVANTTRSVVDRYINRLLLR